MFSFMFLILIIISIVTLAIGIFAITVVTVSVLTTILSLIKSIDMQNDNSHYLKITITKENSIRGLLLALELESASAILKMSLFYSNIIGISAIPSTSTFSINNLIFFVGIFSVRIAIL
jgi:hypothetical protein